MYPLQTLMTNDVIGNILVIRNRKYTILYFF